MALSERRERSHFVDAFAETFPASLKLLLLDHRGAHPAQRLTLPAHTRGARVPPYGPELNPLARVWRDLNDALAWLHFPSLDGQQDSVGPVGYFFQRLNGHGRQHEESVASI
ncbi:MAG: hypothetical protein ACRERE_21670 [Candidatus Entotheonellia bacterium]